MQKPRVQNQGCNARRIEDARNKTAKMVQNNKKVARFVSNLMELISGYDFATHRVVLGANQYILENVGSNIKDLPPRGFFLMAMPYKLGGGSGAPTRLVALLDTSKDQLHGLVAKAPSFNANFLVILSMTMWKLL